MIYCIEQDGMPYKRLCKESHKSSYLYNIPPVSKIMCHSRCFSCVHCPYLIMYSSVIIVIISIDGQRVRGMVLGYG